MDSMFFCAFLEENSIKILDMRCQEQARKMEIIPALAEMKQKGVEINF